MTKPDTFTLTRARDLKEGHLIDSEPILDFLASRGHLLSIGEIAMAADELAFVEVIEIEESREPGQDFNAVIYTPQGNWAVPADMQLPRLVAD